MPTEPEKQFENAEDIEGLILGACLSRKADLVKVVDELKPGDFSLEKHKRMFLDMQKMLSLDRPVSTSTLASHLKSGGHLDLVGGLTYLVSLAGSPELVKLSEYIRIVREKSALRAIIAMGTDLVSQAHEIGAQPRDIVKALDKQILTLGSPFYVARMASLSNWVGSQITDLASQGGINAFLDPSLHAPGLHTGFTKLDALTDGFHRGELSIVAGRPGDGKTSWAMQSAVHIAEKNRGAVAVFSMDMGTEGLFRRMICGRAHVPYMRFVSGETNADERMRLLEATEYIRELPVYIDETPRPDADEIVKSLKRLAGEHDIVLGIIDYVQLIKSANARMNRNDALTEIGETLKQGSKDTGIPLSVLSQLSRQHKQEKRKPELSDLLGSGSLEAVATAIMFLWREDLGNRERHSTKGGADFLLRKNRNGELAEIPMRYIAWRMRFEDPDEVTPQFAY